MPAKFLWTNYKLVLTSTVICWLLIPLCSAMDEQRNVASNCDPGESFYSTLFTFRCCNGDPFDYGHLLSYMDQCSVPPQDPRLSLSASQWLLFECLITKSLNSKPMTLTNFASVMTANLTTSKKSAILSKLAKNNEKQSKSPTNSANSAKIRTMWTKYFEAEFQICFVPPPPYGDQRFNEGPPDGGPPERKPTAGEWAPQNDCGASAGTIGGSSPDIPILPGPFPGMAGCLKSFWTQHDLTNVSSYDRPAMFLCCELMQAGLLKEAELQSKNLDYESLIRKILPKFWSTNTKEAALKEFPGALQLAIDLGNGKGTTPNQNGGPTKNLADMIPLMRAYAAPLLKLLYVHKDSDQFYINFFMLSIVDVALDQIKQPLCRT